MSQPSDSLSFFADHPQSRRLPRVHRHYSPQKFYNKQSYFDLNTIFRFFALFWCASRPGGLFFLFSLANLKLTPMSTDTEGSRRPEPQIPSYVFPRQFYTDDFPSHHKRAFQPHYIIDASSSMPPTPAPALLDLSKPRRNRLGPLWLVAITPMQTRMKELARCFFVCHVKSSPHSMFEQELG